MADAIRRSTIMQKDDVSFILYDVISPWREKKKNTNCSQFRYAGTTKMETQPPGVKNQGQAYGLNLQGLQIFTTNSVTK